MNVLVTGGAGFIGSHLVEKLVTLRHNVTVLDDLSNGHLHNLDRVKNKIVFVKDDVSKTDWMYSSPKFDVIYHLACFPRSMSFQNPQRDVEVNVIGMINTLELARRSKAKVIFSSNSGIYNTSKLPINEETPDNPKTPYDLDKLQSEKYLKLYNQAYEVPFVIFRFATVYGSRQRVSENWKPVIMEFVTKLKNRITPTIYWDGEQTRDFVYVDDVVDALVLSLDWEKAIGKTMILGTGKETSINEVYKIVSDLLDVDVPPNRAPKQLGDIKNMRYDCRKAKLLLSWEAKTPVKEGIKKIMLSLGE
jgi:UDP-glucose 4-epimerase